MGTNLEDSLFSLGSKQLYTIYGMLGTMLYGLDRIYILVKNIRTDRNRIHSLLVLKISAGVRDWF